MNITFKQEMVGVALFGVLLYGGINVITAFLASGAVVLLSPLIAKYRR